MMKHRLLTMALESGSEVLVDTHQPVNRFKGTVLELDETDFTLYHSGPTGGVLWALALADVATVGLLINPPVLERCVDEAQLEERNPRHPLTGQSDDLSDLPFSTPSRTLLRHPEEDATPEA